MSKSPRVVPGGSFTSSRWQKLVKRDRTYRRTMAEAATDEDAIQIAVDAVHESHNGR